MEQQLDELRALSRRLQILLNNPEPGILQWWIGLRDVRDQIANWQGEGE